MYITECIHFAFFRKKLTQLQHAYTCLFRDYDSKLKSEVKTYINNIFTLTSLDFKSSIVYTCVCVCVFMHLSCREEICVAGWRMQSERWPWSRSWLINWRRKLSNRNAHLRQFLSSLLRYSHSICSGYTGGNYKWLDFTLTFANPSSIYNHVFFPQPTCVVVTKYTLCWFKSVAVFGLQPIQTVTAFNLSYQPQPCFNIVCYRVQDN